MSQRDLFHGAVKHVTDLERALGQYALYRSLLRRQEPERALFIAVPKRAFESFLGLPATLAVLRDEGVHMVVFDPGEETLISWLE